MPLLDRAGLKEDVFERLESGLIADLPAVLVPWGVLDEALANRQPGQALGVEVPNDLDPAALEPLLAELALVSIVFPAYADGRGFSLARRLRRTGFSGRLRAQGPLIADQLADALACGFDEVELDAATFARQPTELWQRALAAFSAGYQRGYDTAPSILDQRRLARRRENADAA